LTGVDPGVYNVNTVFGKDSKPFTFGVKRPKIIQKTIGPGEYDTEKGIK